VLAVRLGDVRVLCARVRDVRDIDGVHDLRVAGRRLRAAVRMFGPGLDDARTPLRGLGRALGPVRDLDVQLAWLDDALESATPEEQPGIGALRATRAAGLPHLEVTLQPELELFAVEAAPRLEALFASHRTADQPLSGKRIRRKLARRMITLDAAARVELDTPSVEHAHTVRIIAKKLRYELEITAPALPLGAALLERLPELQEKLGDLHDRDVRIPLVERFLVGEPPASWPGLVKLLREDLQARDKLAHELHQVLVRWDREAVVRSIAQALAGRPE
jgi:CHAD domain-containing protein